MATSFSFLTKTINELWEKMRVAIEAEDRETALQYANRIRSTLIDAQGMYDKMSESYRKTFTDQKIKIEQIIKQLKSPKVVLSKNSSSSGAAEDTPKVTAKPTTSDIRFSDVAGLDDVKEEIIFHVIEPLKNPEHAASYGIKPGSKILLYGPPGTGKTFIGRAIAGEINAAFYTVNCQDMISKYMGESAKQLDELFEEALKNERAAIFFDEFDALASKRGDGSGADAEMSRFVATFLTKVDGFKKSETNKMLLLIAATNRPWALDPAMIRGGRFYTHFYVGFPDQKAREFLVKDAMKKVSLDPDVDLSKLAKAFEGFGGGDIVAACERIRLRTYKRSVSKNKEQQNVTVEDCNAVLSKMRQRVSEEDLAKLNAFREGTLD